MPGSETRFATVSHGRPPPPDCLQISVIFRIVWTAGIITQFEFTRLMGHLARMQTFLITIY